MHPRSPKVPTPQHPHRDAGGEGRAAKRRANRRTRARRAPPPAASDLERAQTERRGRASRATGGQGWGPPVAGLGSAALLTSDASYSSYRLAVPACLVCPRRPLTPPLRPTCCDPRGAPRSPSSVPAAASIPSSNATRSPQDLDHDLDHDLGLRSRSESRPAPPQTLLSPAVLLCLRAAHLDNAARNPRFLLENLL